MTATAHKDPIDTQKPKPRPYGMPKIMALPVGSEARHLVPMEMQSDLGRSSHEVSIRALERLENDFTSVTDAEKAVQAEELAANKAGRSAHRIVQKDGQFYAVGGKMTELADLSDKVLGKRQEAFDAEVRKVATMRENMETLMDQRLICKDTNADAPLRSDIRNHLKGLGHHKARAAVLTAAMNGELPTVHVALTSPMSLTGLKEADLKEVRDFARRSLAPDLYADHQASAKIFDRLIKTSKVLGQKRETMGVYRLKDQSEANAALTKLKSIT